MTKEELGIEKGFKFDITFRKHKGKVHSVEECEIMNFSTIKHVAFKNIMGFYLIPYENIIEVAPSSLTTFEKIKKGGK